MLLYSPIFEVVSAYLLFSRCIHHPVNYCEGLVLFNPLCFPSYSHQFKIYPSSPLPSPPLPSTMLPYPINDCFFIIKKKFLSEGRYRVKIFNNPPSGDYLEKGVKTGIGYPYGCAAQPTRVTNMHALIHQSGPAQDKVNDASSGY